MCVLARLYGVCKVVGIEFSAAEVSSANICDIHSNMFALVLRESSCDEPLLLLFSQVWENCGRLSGFGEMAECAFKSNECACRLFDAFVCYAYEVYHILIFV